MHLTQPGVSRHWKVRDHLTPGSPQVQSAGPEPSRAERIIPRAAACFFTAVILLYAGFIGISNWAADEYDDFGRLAREGWHEVWYRLRWSPRPISEPLFLFYGWTVNQLRRPLITPFLGFLWCVFLFAGLWTYWQAGRERRPHREWATPELLLCLALMASFVSGGSMTEVFYWPAGAVNCLLTLAATLLLFLQTIHGRLATPSGRRIAGACLMVAACSNEMGASLVLVYAVVQVSARAARWRTSASRGPVTWWLAPAIVAGLVIVGLQAFRMGVTERPVARAGENGLGSLVMLGLRALSSEVLGLSFRPDGRIILSGRLLSEVLIALGIALCWSRLRKSSREVGWDTAVLAVALLLSTVLTIAASEVKFHAVCCSRHETMRRCWILMCLAGVAIAIFGPRWLEGLRQRSAILLASLLLCMGVIVAWHVKPELGEYRNYAATYHALHENFRSGFNPHDNRMTFLLLPPGGIIYQQQVPPGVYHRDQPGPAYVQYVLRFFNKQTMVVRSAQEWMGKPGPQ